MGACPPAPRVDQCHRRSRPPRLLRREPRAALSGGGGERGGATAAAAVDGKRPRRLPLVCFGACGLAAGCPPTRRRRRRRGLRVPSGRPTPVIASATTAAASSIGRSATASPRGRGLAAVAPCGCPVRRRVPRRRTPGACVGCWGCPQGTAALQVRGRSCCGRPACSSACWCLLGWADSTSRDGGGCRGGPRAAAAAGLVRRHER